MSKVNFAGKAMEYVKKVGDSIYSNGDYFAVDIEIDDKLVNGFISKRGKVVGLFEMNKIGDNLYEQGKEVTSRNMIEEFMSKLEAVCMAV